MEKEVARRKNIEIGFRKEVVKRKLKAMVGLRVVVLVGLACSLNGLERRRNMPAENGPGSVTPHWTDIYEKPNSESLLSSTVRAVLCG